MLEILVGIGIGAVLTAYIGSQDFTLMVLFKIREWRCQQKTTYKFGIILEGSTIFAGEHSPQSIAFYAMRFYKSWLRGWRPMSLTDEFIESPTLQDYLAERESLDA